MVASVSSVLHVWNSCRMCSSRSCASLVCSADSSLITFHAPRSYPSIAVIVPQPWRPDDHAVSACPTPNKEQSETKTPVIRDEHRSGILPLLNPAVVVRSLRKVAALLLPSPQHDKIVL